MRQEAVQDVFIKYIFEKNKTEEVRFEGDVLSLLLGLFCSMRV